MATQGPRYGTAASNSNSGSESAETWVNPTNVNADDATEATITAATYDSPDISSRLMTSGYGFTIPTGSTIDGITVEIDRRSIIASSGKDFRVSLQLTLTPTGDNKAVTATIWPSTSTVATYGGPTDTWAAGFTVANINSADFGVALSASANIANADIGVDYIRITVDYTAPSVLPSTNVIVAGV